MSSNQGYQPAGFRGREHLPPPKYPSGDPIVSIGVTILTRSSPDISNSNITNMETNNMNVRERFEEIWPVPEGLYWREQVSCYWTENHSMGRLMAEWNDRLDTFTRCQETTDLYLTLIDDLAYDLGRAYNHLKRGTTYNTHSLDRAKQLLEQKK